MYSIKTTSLNLVILQAFKKKRRKQIEISLITSPSKISNLVITGVVKKDYAGMYVLILYISGENMWENLEVGMSG